MISDEGEKNGDEGAEPRLICFCHFVTDEEIRRAIREGATTLEAIKEKTLASTGCTGCEHAVEAILAQLRQAGK